MAAFSGFDAGFRSPSGLRAAIAAAHRRPEPLCVVPLAREARLEAAMQGPARALARRLVVALRARRTGTGVEALLQEFSLSSQEGVALMCLAEALLRIPDADTRDALIRDKIGRGDWGTHAGQAPSLFVNAAAWGLMITGRLVATSSETGLAGALTRLIAKGGEPLIRKGVDLAMRLLGEQFVSGETIAEALERARGPESRGFRHSYDMLGEAALTDADSRAYGAAYEAAVHAIGQAAGRRGIYEGPGISIKLSALHPRYVHSQRERVHTELLPRLAALAGLARGYDIGISIDAEESERLELSLDLLEALCADPGLAGWHGIGFVVQAYQKRAPGVIDHVIDLARRSRRRIMVRLVKGAYWDSEIKRAQVDGMDDYPVYTRRAHTDLAYIACARRLLAAPEAVFPQFATHNALTLASIHELAGGNFHNGQYEFQCLHGMGEPLYDDVIRPVADGGLGRPCRIYAPVGSHRTLLAYLVRRLLENGANTSFVNRVGNPAVDVEELIADPVDTALALDPPGASHPSIVPPRRLFGDERLNSSGIDLASDARLASLAPVLAESAARVWRSGPTTGDAERGDGPAQELHSPADVRDLVGTVRCAGSAEVTEALRRCAAAAALWAGTPAGVRAECLERAAGLMEERQAVLAALVVREAGKTLGAAVSEVREAVDFLRYYAGIVRRDFSVATHTPLGPVVCISPWNFPLAIFTGQVAAALASGNPVLAKPAEQTPLVAAEAVRLLHAAGVPPEALQLLPGDGAAVGAALVADPRTAGVLFTGSTEVAQAIARSLAGRLGPDGRCVPLVAETGGINAMVVDSSALPEQVVHDALQSAFDSAGQRCSALRLLCVQSEVAEAVLGMLLGAMQELVVGPPDRLATDVGPVIDAEARDAIERHVAQMRTLGHRVHRIALPPDCGHGFYVAPTVIELDSARSLTREVFGPVLHFVRFERADLAGLLADLGATGYGLTFAVHSRIDETIDAVLAGVRAGNRYVNRNQIGAVVGVQPFGGEGLSGTGPKAGGPLYLRRLTARAPPLPAPAQAHGGDALDALDRFLAWLGARGESGSERLCKDFRARSPLGTSRVLRGPTGERNTWELVPRGTVLCCASSRAGVLAMIGAVLATGNTAIVLGPPEVQAVCAEVAGAAGEHLRFADRLPADRDAYGAALVEARGMELVAWSARIAARDGPVVPVIAVQPAADGTIGPAIALEWLMAERSTSVNTAAAGGNASLMSVG